MHVFELTIPGTRLEAIDDVQKRDVEALLELLVGCLEDAAVSLALFEDARALPEAKRHRLQAGEIPRSYRHRLPFIYAKSCLYALDTMGKSLKLLRALPASPAQVDRAFADFEAAFPKLVHLRDSAHHAEDRVQGKRRSSRIDLRPVMNGVLHAPNGGVLIVDMLSDDRFGTTLGDGTFAEVEISAASVASAQRIVQSVHDAFQWKGPSSHRPN